MLRGCGKTSPPQFPAPYAGCIITYLWFYPHFHSFIGHRLLASQDFSVFWGVEVLISIFAARPNIHYVAWLKYFQKSNSLVELFSFLTFPFFLIWSLSSFFVVLIITLLQYKAIRRHLAELFLFYKIYRKWMYHFVTYRCLKAGVCRFLSLYGAFS